MSYLTGRPEGALPAIVPGFGNTPCRCSLGADETSQRLPALLVAGLAGLAAGYAMSRRARR